MRTEDDLVDFAGHFPDATGVELENFGEMGESPALNIFAEATEMIIFLDPKDPKAILQHPVFGPLLQAYEHMFVQDDKGEWKLENNRIFIPAPAGGSLQRIHVAMGGGIDGDPTADEEFLLPSKWRNAVASAVADVVQRVADGYEKHLRAKQKRGKKQSRLGIYLDGKVLESPNAPHVIRAIARAVGNLRERTDFYKSCKDEQFDNGKPPAEAGSAEAHKADEKKVGKLRAGVRKHVGDVLLFTDKAVDVDGKSDMVLEAFRVGDMHSRMQLLAKALAECPYNIMKVRVLLRALVSVANEAIEKGAPITEIEVIGPESLTEYVGSLNCDLIKFTTFEDLAESGGLDLRAMKAVHQGASKETDPGPISVIVKYRGGGKEAVRHRVCKGLVEDTGGLNVKPHPAGKDMQGDMGGAAVGIATIGRLAEEQPEVNINLAFGMAANHVDGESYVPGTIVQTAAGQMLMVIHTDAEGRIVLCDLITHSLYSAHKDGLESEWVDSVSTLTGAAAFNETGTTPFATRSKALGRSLEDSADQNGEFVVLKRVRAIDDKAVAPGGDEPRVEVTNLTHLPNSGRGVTTPVAAISTAAGLSGTLKATYGNWDIAGGLSRDPTTPKDVLGQMPFELPWETMWQRLVAKKPASAPNPVAHS